MDVGSPDRESSGVELEVMPSDGKGVQNKEAILLSDLSLGYVKDTDVVHSVTSTLKRNTITIIIGQ